MVSGLFDFALTWGIVVVAAFALSGVVSRLLDAVGVPSHRLRSVVSAVLAVLGGITVAGFVATGL